MASESTASSAGVSSRVDNPAYRNDIDGLRAFAVLAVIGFHAFPDWISGGFVGVDIFFVISGFLISTIIFNGLYGGKFSFRHFYSRRVLRIFPALVVVLAAGYVFGWFALFSDEYKQFGKHIASSAAFISNFVLWGESGYFDNAAETKPLLHLWSLGVEEQFYIAFPALVWAWYKFRFDLLKLALLIIAASFVLNLFEVATNPTAAFYSPATRFWELLVGSLLAYVALHRKAPEFVSDSNTRESQINGRAFFTSKVVRDMGSLLGIILIAVAVFALSKRAAFPGWWALLPTLGAAFVIWVGRDTWFNRVFLANRAMIWIGLISYPLYLWHWLLLSYARILESSTPSIKIRLAAVVMSFVLAWATYRYVEKPIRFGRSHVRLKVAVLCALMVVAGSIGYATFKNEGYVSREINKNFAERSDLQDPYRAMRSDGSCDMYLGVNGGLNETCLTRSASPEIMIMGDSHAMAFNSATYAGRSSLNTITVSGYSCLPFTKYISPNCIAVTNLALDITKSLNSISTVLLVNIGGDSYHADKFKDGENTIDADAAFLAGYSDVISRLIALKKRVIFVVDVPDLDFDPKACMKRRPLSLTNKASFNCSTARTYVENRNKKYREFMTELTRRNPALLVYDSQKVFCDDTWCSAGDGSNIFYFDTNHLSVSGSERVLTDLSGWLRSQGVNTAVTENKLPVFSVPINSAPTFDSQQGWGEGYTKAIGHGPGVVVGPGSGNPNVFAQSFAAKPGDRFKIIARGSSVNSPQAQGRVQVNWVEADGKFISVSSKSFELTHQERTVEHFIVAPAGAASGTLYVVAGGPDSVVRYTEMRLLGEDRTKQMQLSSIKLTPN